MNRKKRKPPSIIPYTYITQSATILNNGIAALFHSTNYCIITADTANYFSIHPVRALAFMQARFLIFNYIADKQSPTIEENRLQDAILRAVNRILSNQEQYAENLIKSLRLASGSRTGEFDTAALRKRIDEKKASIADMAANMAKDKIGIDEIERTAAVICAEIAEFEARLRLYEQENMHKQCENSRLNEMLSELNREQAELEQYEDAAVRRLIESVKVVDAENIMARFRSGMEIGETLH